MHIFSDEDDLGPEITLVLPQDVVESLCDTLWHMPGNQLQATAPAALRDELRAQLAEQVDS